MVPASTTLPALIADTGNTSSLRVPSSNTLRFAPPILTLLITALLAACDTTTETLITIADARDKPAQLIDTGIPGDSVGDLLVFDQPLLDEAMHPIGRNSGYCIRTRIGQSFQCQWTLSMSDGTIQVAGREFDKGTSHISIIGGTGRYSGIEGELKSTNNNDGTFSQSLHFR